MYNLCRKEPTKYKLGDLVAIKRTQQGPGLKLRSKFIGPYKITSIKPNALKYNNTGTSAIL